MTDLELAKRNLAGHTICLCKDGKLLTSKDVYKRQSPYSRAVFCGSAVFLLREKIFTKQSQKIFLKYLTRCQNSGKI